jgi:general transcription factor 3C polypeptide 3 (transcription factor C subunit 4)
MHQLSIFNLAVHYYKMALDTPPMSEDLDLSRESAFNLALIYQNSGNPALARQMYQKYIVFE